MKKRMISLTLAFGMVASLLTACNNSTTSWTVTCPWAPSGVAAMVSQKAAAKSTEYSDSIILVADAIQGDTATVNTWVTDTKADDPELVFVNEGMFSIAAVVDPEKLQFTYDDFIFVENLYSSVLVMSADASLNIKSIEDLKAFLESSTEVSVAANGATTAEAFLAAALFGSMGYGDKLKLTPYNSAAEAAQAVSRGETNFAVSHQSQILEAYQQGNVSIVCAFDENDISEGVFSGVEGVGKYGYPYFRNRCFVAARAGTNAETVAELKDLYKKILADDEVASWMRDTMLLEVDTMTEDQALAHIESVKSLVTEYYDIVVG